MVIVGSMPLAIPHRPLTLTALFPPSTHKGHLDCGPSRP